MPRRHKDAPPESDLYAPIEWEAAASYEDILYERAEAIARITINRPEVLNAFRPQTLAELRDAFRRARDDTGVASIIFTGAGDDAFCSGGDQRIRGDDGYIGDDEVAEQGIGRLDVGDLHVQIRRLPKPVLAAVAGYAVGGGQILHLVCDLSIAADNAVFGQTGPRVGSFDGGFGAGLLARAVGVRKAKEIWFLCRLYDADEALRDGARQRGRTPRSAGARGGRLVPRDGGALRALAAPAEVELQRRRGRAHRAPAAVARRDPALLHDRGGPGGTQLLEGGAPAGLLQVPQAALNPRIWLMAARPRTLPAALAPVLVGSAAAYFATGGELRVGPFIAALIGSVFIQIGTNLANDYSDAKRGADTDERLGPVRVTSAGLVAPRRVLHATWLAFAVASLAGLYLAFVAGPVIIVIGAASILAGVLYTGGPRPYGYAGMGELFVFLFFGLVAVNGSYFVQLERLDLLPLLLSVPVGFLSTAILVVNNVRDLDTDRRAGKRTLAVRLGRARARQLYLGLSIGSFAFLPIALALGDGPVAALLGVRRRAARAGPREGGDRAHRRPVAERGARGDRRRCSAAYSLLLSAGLVIAAN